MFSRYTFVRHGQCVANEQGRVVGQLDSPLTALGREQANRAAAQLARRSDLTAVVTSDLERAHATARIIAESLDLPLFPEPGLREQYFGTMEGQLFSSLTDCAADDSQINEVRWGGGESVRDLYDRLAQTFDRITVAHPGPTVLVTHGHVIHVAMCLLAGGGLGDLDWFDLPNGGIVMADDDRCNPVGTGTADRVEHTESITRGSPCVLGDGH